jgi:hypothetical protein
MTATRMARANAVLAGCGLSPAAFSKIATSGWSTSRAFVSAWSRRRSRPGAPRCRAGGFGPRRDDVNAPVGLEVAHRPAGARACGNPVQALFSQAEQRAAPQGGHAALGRREDQGVAGLDREPTDRGRHPNAGSHRGRTAESGRSRNPRPRDQSPAPFRRPGFRLASRESPLPFPPDRAASAARSDTRSPRRRWRPATPPGRTTASSCRRPLAQRCRR